MPELPEVETVVRDLRLLLCGKCIAAVRAGRKKLRQPWKKAWNNGVVNRRVEAVRRRGKWIVVDLANGGHLLVHLGMTGQLTVRAATAPQESHTHLVFSLDGGDEHLRFRDIRRFGSVQFVAATPELEQHFRDRLGPEPWDLQPAAWHGRLHQSRRSLKALLLDQTVVAGVGNIYADEALFVAGLRPNLKGCQTTAEQAERLRRAIVQVLERSIAARGTSIRNYVGGSGLRGGFQTRLLVYGRDGQPCSRCGRTILCTRLAGRSTHYCPGCQSQRPRNARTYATAHRT